MKKIVLMLFIVNVFAISCNTNESEVFESEKLRGKYKVDLTPFVAETVKSEEGDNKWTKMGKGLAGLALSSIDIELSFYDNNKGIMYIDGGLIDFANALSDEPVEKLHEFTYKVEHDSILYMKGKNENDYKNWAGVPLRSYKLAMNYINTTTTKKGLTIQAFLHEKEYEKGVCFDKKQVEKEIKIERNEFLPQWNYKILF